MASARSSSIDGSRGEDAVEEALGGSAGLVSGARMAHLGHHLISLDSDESKIEDLKQGGRARSTRGSMLDGKQRAMFELQRALTFVGETALRSTA